MVDSLFAKPLISLHSIVVRTPRRSTAFEKFHLLLVVIIPEFGRPGADPERHAGL